MNLHSVRAKGIVDEKFPYLISVKSNIFILIMKKNYDAQIISNAINEYENLKIKKCFKRRANFFQHIFLCFSYKRKKKIGIMCVGMA